MKKGFTLVELSIVLVIIGLLIGGILIGQSLINSAKTQSGIRQIQQIDAAVNAFKSKYKGLPGDTRVFGGNGDGVLTSYFVSESTNFWVNLQISGFANSKKFSAVLPGGGINSDTNNPNLPISVFDKKASILPAVVRQPSATPAPNPTNFYQIGAWQGMDVVALQSADYYGDQSGSFMLPVDVAAIDAKIDDGKPALGVVQASRGSSEHCPKLCTDFTGVNQTTAVYNVNTKDAVCFVSIGMLDTVLPLLNYCV